MLGQDTPLVLAAQVTVPAVDLRQYDALLDEAGSRSVTQLHWRSQQCGRMAQSQEEARIKGSRQSELSKEHDAGAQCRCC